MIIEILIGVLIAIILLYVFYLYLEWCNKYSTTKLLYNVNPLMVLTNDRQIIESYGKYMVPEYLSDTFKPIRFWILYYLAKWT